MATEALITESSEHNIHGNGDPKIADSKIWFGKISRASFQTLLPFLDLLKPVRYHLATKLAINSQAPANEKSRRKST